jgi:hypothetical protein
MNNENENFMKTKIVCGCKVNFTFATYPNNAVVLHVLDSMNDAFYAKILTKEKEEKAS